MLTLPTNGARMTAAQFDELEAYIRAGFCSDIERMMFRQLQCMIYGAEAHRLVLENERTCRMTAEQQVRDLTLDLNRAKTRRDQAEAEEAALVAVLRNLQKVMQLPRKYTKGDLVKVIAILQAEIEKALEA